MDQKTATDAKDFTLGIALFGSTIWVIFTGVINVLSSYNLEANSMTYPYLFLFILYPPILWVSLKIKPLSCLLSPYQPINNARLGLLWVNLIFLILARWGIDQKTFPPILSVIFCVYLFALSFQNSVFLQSSSGYNRYQKISYIFSSICFLILYCTTLITDTFNKYYETITYIFQHNLAISFLIVFSFSVTTYILYSKKIEEKNIERKWLIILTYFSPLLLFDVKNSFELEHYNAYIGPAISALHGKVPLVDIFCQYGLSYLIFTLAFLFFPNTYGTAAFVVSSLNIVYLISFLAIFRTIIKNPFHFFIIGICTVFGSYFSISASIPNLFPSSLSLRYLPVILFLWYLLKTQEKNTIAGKWSVAIIIFCSALWNLESLIFCCFLYGFYVFIFQKSIKNPITYSLKNTFVFLLISASFTAIYFLIFKHIPNYILYAKYLYSYISPENEISIITKYSGNFDLYKNTLYVSVVIMINFTLLYFSLFFNTPEKYTAGKKFQKLYLINFFSIFFFSYKAFRSSGEAVFLIIFFSFIPFLYLTRTTTKNALIRNTSNFTLLITCFCFIIISYFNILYMKVSTATINNGLIGHWVNYRSPLPENFIDNLLNFCTNRAQDPFLKENEALDTLKSFNYTPCQTEARKEISDIIANFFQGQSNIPLFHKDSVQILFENHKAHACLPNPVNDELFPDLTKFNLKNCIRTLREGSIIVVDKTLDLYDIELKLLEEISQRFTLRKITEKPNLLVLKLQRINSDNKSDFILPHYFTNKFILENGKISEYIPGVKKTLLAGKTEYLIDLKSEYTLNKIKLWKKLSSKNPLFVQIKNLFVHAISISVSDNGKVWNIAFSENNIPPSKSRYYEATFPAVNARYVKIEIPDEDNRIYIRRIDIFPYFK